MLEEVLDCVTDVVVDKLLVEEVVTGAVVDSEVVVMLVGVTVVGVLDDPDAGVVPALLVTLEALVVEALELLD